MPPLFKLISIRRLSSYLFIHENTEGVRNKLLRLFMDIYQAHKLTGTGTFVLDACF